MLCTNCGAANADDAKVCVSCGQPLSDVWQSPKSELVSADAAEEIIYAGFWERFAALIVDSLLLWVFMMAFFAVLGIGMAAIGGSQVAVALGVAANILPWIISAVYFATMESGERGATYGKRLLKLRVVDANGNRISRGRGVGRWFAHALSSITFFIGYIIQPFTARKQALHDMVAGTLVVKTEKSSGGLAVVITILAAFFMLIFVVGILAAVAIPAYQDYVGKANLMKAEVVGRLATQSVESYVAQTGRIPASLEETGMKLPPSPEIANVTVNPQNGEVQVILSRKGVPAGAAGKALVFDATRNNAGKIVWVCTGPGIPRQMLPPDCK